MAPPFLDRTRWQCLKATYSRLYSKPTITYGQSISVTCAPLPHVAGLEMRVAFGDVWKQSLTELSGGQRSLLALSLILALCR